MAYLAIFVILVYSIILHELSHAVVARMNGDPTAERAGRLTLNPLPHIDPIGTVLLPLILVLSHSGIFFAWAKPVPFDPRYFRNRAAGIFTVGIAGPLTNVLLALVFAAAYRLGGRASPWAELWYYGAYVNVLLAVFNLVPIPPLDGSRAVSVFLPNEAKKVYYSLERWGLLILLILLYTGVLGRVVLPLQLRIMGWLLG
jgi:Zn-dependent protease